MSLYCKGRNCDKKEKCLRYKYGKPYEGKYVEGVWYVSESACTNNKYEDGVFEKEDYYDR